VNKCGDNTLSEAAGHSQNGRVFFVKETAGITGKLILTTKDEVLIIVEHLILRLIANRNGGCYRNLQKTSASFIVEQSTAEIEPSDHALYYCISSFTLTLNAKTTSTMHEFTHDSIGEPRSNLVTQSLAL